MLFAFLSGSTATNPSFRNAGIGKEPANRRIIRWPGIGFSFPTGSILYTSENSPFRVPVDAETAIIDRHHSHSTNGRAPWSRITFILWKGCAFLAFENRSTTFHPVSWHSCPIQIPTLPRGVRGSSIHLDRQIRFHRGTFKKYRCGVEVQTEFPCKVHRHLLPGYRIAA